MLNPITFVVTDEGGSRDVIVSAPDYVAYEAKFNQPVLKALGDLSMTAYLFLIWNAMSRTKQTTLSWEDWLAESPSFDQGEVTEPVPLERRRRRGSSLDSPSNSE
jgi:hypothetical protein